MVKGQPRIRTPRIENLTLRTKAAIDSESECHGGDSTPVNDRCVRTQLSCKYHILALMGVKRYGERWSSRLSPFADREPDVFLEIL